MKIRKIKMGLCCEDIFDLFSDFIENELEENIFNIVRKHLDNCQNCLSLFNTFSKTLELYHEFEQPKLTFSRKRIFHRWLHIKVKRLNVSKGRRKNG